jgi:AcrR family transcriptional regulator
MASRQKPKRIRGEAKRDAILTAAWDVFREVGYAQASVDEITRRAGGSKMSLYAHFRNKESLFRAVVERQTQAVSTSLPAPGSLGDARQMLTALATAMVNNISGATVQDIHRVALSARMEKSEIGRMLYKHGTERVIRQLAEVIDAEMKGGRLKSDDPLAAAESFLGLLLGASYIRLALGVPERITTALKKGRVARAVRIFMAAYDANP